MLDKVYYAMYSIVYRTALFKKEDIVDSQLKKGLLEICVLSAIKEEESYGYKIISDLEPYVQISESTLYPILRRLVSCGAVTTKSIEKNGRLRKYFKITPIGQEKINEFILDINDAKKIIDFINKGGSL